MQSDSLAGLRTIPIRDKRRKVMKFIVKWNIPKGSVVDAEQRFVKTGGAAACRRDDDRAMAWHERRRSVDRRDQ